MKDIQTNLTILQRLWEDSLAVELIAEPLTSVLAAANATEVAEEMKTRNWDVMGMRQDDSAPTSAYLTRQDLKDGSCCQYAQSFEIQDLVSSYAPIYQCLPALCERKRLFVLGRSGVEGIVTAADLQKQPVRLMLFAAVSLMEMAMLARIRQVHPAGQWASLLGQGRIKAAEALHAERRKKGQDIDMADCLQLCDKAGILLKGNEWTKWGFSSKVEASEFFGSVQTLRDNLAHAQDPSEGTDWGQICSLFIKIEQITRQMAGSASADDAGEGAAL